MIRTLHFHCRGPGFGPWSGAAKILLATWFGQKIKIKINSKQIKDLNVKGKAIKVLEESIGVNLCDLELGSVFLDMIPKAQATKGRVDKLGFFKIKNFCAENDTIKKVKKQSNRKMSKVYEQAITEEEF